MYPFSATPGQPGEQFQYYQCMDAHTEHFAGAMVGVGDWMQQNLSLEDRAFLEKEADYLSRLGLLLHRAGPQRQKEWLFLILFYRYYNYDLEKPFMRSMSETTRNCWIVLIAMVGRRCDSMYVLEHSIHKGGCPRQRHSWQVCGFCGNEKLLEKVCAAPARRKELACCKSVGTCAAALRCCDTQVYGKAG